MKNNPAMYFRLPADNGVEFDHKTASPTVNMMKESSTKGKTKRTRGCFKSSEEMEMERRIHIEVERNRRKQMNEYLQALRQLMPPSYVQRGDQASIIGGAIEFVKELKHNLEYLKSKKIQIMPCANNQRHDTLKAINIKNKAIIDNHQNKDTIVAVEELEVFPRMEEVLRVKSDNGVDIMSSLAYMEVKLVGLDVAIIKILSRRRPKQLQNIITTLQHDLCFTILRTNINTMDEEVLYTFEVQGLINQIYTSEEIARLIQNIFDMIYESNVNGSEQLTHGTNYL